MKKKTAYLGHEGSYSFLLAQKMEKKDHVFVGKETFAEIVSAIEKGEHDAGILPIENSTTGSILDVYELLLNADVQIVEEGVLKLHHLLLGHKGAKPTRLSVCYCHQEAYKQCQKALKKKN